MEGILLQYNTLSKPQKMQVIKFIRKVYDCTQINVRDIIKGEYKALLNNGLLTGVAYELKKPNY